MKDVDSETQNDPPQTWLSWFGEMFGMIIGFHLVSFALCTPLLILLLLAQWLG